MKTVTIRDLRTSPRQVRESLEEAKQAVLTANGKPVAVMIAVDSGTLDETLDMLQRARAQQAVRTIRRQARETGAEGLSSAEVDAVIQDVRKKRRR